MKIQIISEMDKINISVSHQELVTIQLALKNKYPQNIEELNNKLFDKDEFDNLKTFNKFKKKISSKLNKVLNKILVF